MTAYVIDASAVVLALTGRSAAADALRDRVGSARLHAPHLVDAEVGNVLRRHEQRGLISPQEAVTALRVGAALIHHRYPHTRQLAQTAWRQRSNLSFYDALYAALAARLGVPLLTADARLGRAPQPGCTVEIV